MSNIHTETLNGYTLTINQDADPINPRIDYDHLGKMVCFHKRYNLGDKHNFDIEDVQAIAESNEYISLPLYLYDHSGITISTSPFSCIFDSGQVGIIFVSCAQVKQEFNVQEISPELTEKILGILRGEVQEYDDYLTGNVYFYAIEDSDGICIDSCGNLIGYDYALNEAKSALSHIANKRPIAAMERIVCTNTLVSPKNN